MRYEIIFENDLLVAVNKPSGLLSIPDREGKEVSLKHMLRDKYDEIFTVHRLDRATSGVIVFAKDEHTHKQLSQLFENRETENRAANSREDEHRKRIERITDSPSP